MAGKGFRIAATAAALSMGLAFAVQSASAAPIYPLELGKSMTSQIETASFWGWPYPYGYTYGRWGAQYPRNCVRHVRVQTRHGWRTRRIWVCG